MKKIKINIDDLMTVLEAMKETGGTKEIIFFEYNDLPAIADADEPENIVMFQASDEEGNVEEDAEIEIVIDDETMH